MLPFGDKCCHFQGNVFIHLANEAHYAMYPMRLVEIPIKAGCPESGIVLDPFMGSGTTAVVARRLGRKYIGFELNPDYIDICRKRLKQGNLFS